ncbi:MAG TPA: GNAT family N-acetyltransferase [Candidatus Dormibacteraeota bacterium]
MSVQLDALAEEACAAAAAQNRASGESTRKRYGEILRTPAYPDLTFLNAIVDLVAPSWQVADLEEAVVDAMPSIGYIRASSRDRQTITALGPRLVDAGYAAEARVAMVQTFGPEERPSLARIRPVKDAATWVDFENLIRQDLRDGWTPAMTAQLIGLYRWRDANLPQRFFLAYEDGRPLGHVGLYQHGTTGLIHALFTDAQARRRGVASALLHAVRNHATAAGCDRIALHCARDSELPAFYQRQGFRAVGEELIWVRPRAA